jgi:hypothetical protein
VSFGLLYDFVPHFSLQFLTFIYFKSSSTWSSHLTLCLPTALDEHGSHPVNFLFKSSSTWSSHLTLGLPTVLDEHGSHPVNILFKSSSTWSSHLTLGLPTVLDEHGSHPLNILTVLAVSIPSRALPNVI